VEAEITDAIMALALVLPKTEQQQTVSDDKSGHT
jgi:hypothetical protein